MADLKISQFPNASALNGAELVPIVQGGATSVTPLGAIIALAHDVVYVDTAGTTPWTKPVGARLVYYCLLAGGAGGTSGIRIGSSTNASGGSAGGGGALIEGWLDASELDDTEDIVVGAGGVGGAAQVGGTNTTPT